MKLTSSKLEKFYFSVAFSSFIFFISAIIVLVNIDMLDGERKALEVNPSSNIEISETQILLGETIPSYWKEMVALYILLCMLGHLGGAIFYVTRPITHSRYDYSINDDSYRKVYWTCTFFAPQVLISLIVFGIIKIFQECIDFIPKRMDKIRTRLISQ